MSTVYCGVDQSGQAAEHAVVDRCARLHATSTCERHVERATDGHYRICVHRGGDHCTALNERSACSTDPNAIVDRFEQQDARNRTANAKLETDIVSHRR